MWVWTALILLGYDGIFEFCKLTYNRKFNLSSPLTSFPLLHTGGGCKERSQPKDNFQAQEDKVRLQESTAEPDQQAAERA